MVLKEKINFLDFDIYSRRISFFYKNKEKFGSTFGFVLTVLYIVLSIIIFLIYFIRTVKRVEVTASDSTIYPTDIPSIDINNNLFYMAFGLEDPVKLTRIINETIYYPEVIFVEKIKENGEFITKNETIIEIEKCNSIKFGEDYQLLLERHQINNSYCIKDLNLKLEGGPSHIKMSYIKINIYPCVNSTENNNHCQPQEIIDRYLTSAYFSILAKDIGFNPLNYKVPIIPLLQYLYTPIDKSILKEYIIYFGITEINTDTGLFLNTIKKETYLKYVKDLHSIFFFENKPNYGGKEIFSAQIRLEETIYFHKRTFTKMSQVLSITGGYMQIISTVFALIALLTKKFSLEQNLLNSLFNFNIKQRKIILCIEYKKRLDYNPNFDKRKDNNNTFILYEPKKSIVSRKSRRDSIMIFRHQKDSTLRRSQTLQPNATGMKSLKSQSGSASNSNQLLSQLSKNLQKKNEDFDPNINRSKVNMILKDDDLVNNEILKIKNPRKKKSNYNIFNDLKELDQGRRSTVNFTIFDYYCLKNLNRRKAEIELFNFGINFFKSQMDIINFFNILILTQIMLTQHTENKKNVLTRTIELSMD